MKNIFLSIAKQKPWARTALALAVVFLTAAIGYLWLAPSAPYKETLLQEGKQIDFIKSSFFDAVVRDGKIIAWPEEKLLDGDLTTHWCTVDQTREWVYLRLADEFTISRIGIANGNGLTDGRFACDARAKDIRIEFSNGWKKDLRLADQIDMQYFDLEPQKTESIKLTVRGLYPTTMWSHLCLRELEVYAQEKIRNNEE